MNQKLRLWALKKLNGIPKELPPRIKLSPAMDNIPGLHIPVEIEIDTGGGTTMLVPLELDRFNMTLTNSLQSVSTGIDIEMRLQSPLYEATHPFMRGLNRFKLRRG